MKKPLVIALIILYTANVHAQSETELDWGKAQSETELDWANTTYVVISVITITCLFGIMVGTILIAKELGTQNRILKQKKLSTPTNAGGTISVPYSQRLQKALEWTLEKRSEGIALDQLVSIASAKYGVKQTDIRRAIHGHDGAQSGATSSTGKTPDTEHVPTYETRLERARRWMAKNYDAKRGQLYYAETAATKYNVRKEDLLSPSSARDRGAGIAPMEMPEKGVQDTLRSEMQNHREAVSPHGEGENRP